MPVQNPVLVFAILMMIVLIAPLVSVKIKLPGIIGLIVAGIVLGPHALGVLEQSSEIELLGTVGLLYLMFLVGLELDRIQFIRNLNHSLTFGFMTFIVPLVLGSLMGHYMLGFNWQASILLSSMFSSHTLLTYPIVSRLGLVRQRAVTSTIGGTIFTDTAALLVLAVISAAHQGEGGMYFWPRLFSFMLVYVAAVILILPRLSKWFFRNIASDGTVAFTGVLSAMFIGAYLAHVSGLEPILGAFLVGLILNSFIPEKSTLMTRVQFVGHALFIPFFLISVGMLVNVRMFFAGAETMIISAAMVFAGLVTKWLAAYSSQILLKYSPDEGKLIYGLSVNQAAATLAAVIVGYNIGIFPETVLTGTVVMILVTTFVGSWVTDRYARKVAIAEEAQPYEFSDAPQRVLVPLSNPKSAKALMELAMLLRRSNSEEPIYPMMVVPSGDNVDERIAKGEKRLGHAVVQALEADVPVMPVTRTATDISNGICQALTDLRISTIVLGWKGASGSRMRIFGRITDSILENSTQMMCITHCLVPINTIKRVVLALPPLAERQPGFAAAIEAIKNLTHQLDASLLTISVSPTIDQAASVIKETSPKLQEKYELLNNWKQLLDWLKNIQQKDDLLIIISVRKGRLAWQPDLDRLPQLINKQFPGISNMIVYPSDKSWEKVIDARSTEIFAPSFLPAGHIQLDLDETTLSEAIYRLLSVEFLGEPGKLKRIANELVHISNTESVELLPGIVLLHTHIPEILTSTVFLGVNRNGWNLPNTTKDAEAMFILLSSVNAPPEIHLKALADIVRPLLTFKSAQPLTKAVSVYEILDLFYPDNQDSNKNHKGD
jgi:Kef-type K+ transport system membrane component KefB/mannitol/fructose-specific phosphotransferase system IIA component (Ntr-type)